MPRLISRISRRCEQHLNLRVLSQSLTFQKIKSVVFLLVPIASMFALPTVASLARAQQPIPTASPVPNFSGLPKQPPPGWDAKMWTGTREHCNQLGAKSRAHQPSSAAELSFAQTCAALSVELLNPRKGPIPGSYPNPVPKGEH